MKKPKIRSAKRIVSMGFAAVLGFSSVPMEVSAVETDAASEYVIKGGEEYHGYVDVTYDAPESIYEGLSVEYGIGNIPASYDAREYGQVTSIKNQSPYGTCWSFATIAALESSLLSQGFYKDIDLSEYHLITYTFNGVEDPLGGLANDSITYSGTMEQALNAGGNVTVAYHALSNWMGAVEEKDAVYPGYSETVEELPRTQENAYLNDIAHLQQAYLINKSDTDAIKQTIMDYGSVTASFYYDGNYMFDSAYYNDSNTNSNHAVTIVGWDDNYSKSNFGKQPKEDGAWLVKNSWDTWFGDEGYCWISYQDKSLQDTLCAFIGEKADNYDNNYQYDGSYYNTYYTFQQATAANVFQIQDGKHAELLEAVAFETGSPNMNYSIQIYTDITNADNPTSGTAMLEQPVEGTVVYQGYHTIKLPTAVKLLPNQEFAVVIDFDKGGKTFDFPVEVSCVWNGINFSAQAEAKQSLLKYNGNSRWWDIGASTNANLRVKAFTSNVEEEIVAATGVSLPIESHTMEPNASYHIAATIMPADCTELVKWSSSDKSVATVKHGKNANEAVITSLSEGTTTITVTVGDYSDSCVITVAKPSKESLVKAFVVRMYTVALGREAEPEGVEYWAARLLSKKNDGEDVAHGFFDGKEFQSRELTDAEYIGILYGTFFNRTPAEEEVSYYEGLIENGATRDTLLNNFIASSEFDTLCTAYGITSKFTQEELVAKFVERMYTVALGREAEEDGTSYWVELLISKQKDGEDVAKGFFNGKEFIGRNLSDEDYVQTLYGTFFDRTAGESEVSYYLELLQNLTRDDVLNSFINSAEFAALCDEYEIVAIFTREILVSNFVERLYTEALGRTAAEEEIGYYTELLLNKTITGTAAADRFISSTEFEARGLSDREYIATLYKTFFNRVPSESDMKYWLKVLVGNGRRPVLIGFANSAEFAALCDSYGIVAGEIKQ